MPRDLVHIWLQRFRDTGVQTLDNTVLVVNGKEVFKCVSLELSWILNQRDISCIPTGTYPVEIRYSDTYGKHLHIQNVPDRDMILMHVLNYFKESEGCIGVGEKFTHLNNDNEYDITRSKDTLEELLSLIPEGSEIQITIFDHPEKQVFYHV